MDFLSDLADSQVVLLVGAVAIFFLLSKLLFKVLSSSAGTILALVSIVLICQYAFGISPRSLWYEVSHLPQSLARLAQQIA